MLTNKNDIEIEYINIFDLQKYKIAIPIFQRFYDWKDKQTHEIKQDILEAINKQSKDIYLLDFIGYYNEDDPGILEIADGQQRIVTINILIKAINDYIDKNNLSITPIDLFEISYDTLEYDNKYKTAFYKYMCSPFKKIYLAMESFIRENNEKLKDIIDVIKHRIFIYLKIVSNSDDAFNIFTQINTGGKPLSKEEVIKTTIDQYASIYSCPVKSITNDLKNAIVSYYKIAMTTKNDSFDSIAIMSFLKKYVVCDKKSFQKFVNYLETISTTFDYSISYIIRFINRQQLNDIINVMTFKEIDVSTANEYVEKIMTPLCLLSIVMTMKKSNPGGIIKSLYSTVIDDLKNNSDPSTISKDIASFIDNNKEMCTIDYQSFIDGLANPDFPIRIKESLLILDVILRNKSSYLKVSSINLEHIYPQKPNNDWIIVGGWPTSRDEQQKWINNIGNLLLLNAPVNKKIQNKYITDKIVEYKRIIPRDLTLKTPTNTVDFDRFAKEKQEYIEERNWEIADNIYNTFPLAKIILSNYKPLAEKLVIKVQKYVKS